MDLTAYVDHCNALLRDVEHSLADYKALEAGWTLRYAVDFSEIYSYVMPRDSHETAPFSDGWINDDDPLRQFYILSRFFGEKNILLPRPYAMELGGFTERLAAKQLASALDQYIDALKDIDKVIDHPQTTSILKRVADFDTHPPTDAEFESVFAYFDKYAPGLVAFARGADLEPFDRLKNLMKEQPFIELEDDIPAAAAYVDESRIKRCFRLLSAKRAMSNAAANLIDAQALEHVRAANEALATQKCRVLLISRSSYMMTVVQSECSDLNDVYIRHPRTVSAAYRPGDTAVAVVDEAELLLRRESLRAFINGAKEIAERRSSMPGKNTDILEEVVNDTTRMTLRELLERIKNEWHSIDAYSSALTAAGETRAKNVEASRKAVAIELLSLLRNRRRLRERVLLEIRQIFREVRRDRDTVAFRLQSATPNDSSGSVVYPIRFRSEPLRKRVEELSATWLSALSDAEELFSLSIAADDDYDCLLGIAVSLAAIGRWRLARRYTDYALVTQPVGQRREGLFLRAVCYNRTSKLGESLSAATNRMAKAIESIEEALSEVSEVDPRYLNERAALKLWQIEFVRSSEGGALAKVTVPRPEDVEAELTVALPAARTDKLTIQILNSLCYASLLAKDYKMTSARLADLQTALTKAYPQRWQWPAFAVDTVDYASFVVNESGASVETIRPEAIEAWSQELSNIITQPDVSNQEKRLIASHVSEMEDVAARWRLALEAKVG